MKPMMFFFLVILLVGRIPAGLCGEIDAVVDKPVNGSTAVPSGAVPAGMTDIHDIRPPAPMDRAISAWLIVLGMFLAVLLMTAVWWAWRKFRGNPQTIETIIPELPPEMIARQALDELKSGLHMDGKAFYFQLSAILRQYVEGRYRVGAPEMTTEEFLPHIDRLPLDRSLSSSLKHLCRTMDPVKFGGVIPAETRMMDDLAFVRRLVDQTTPTPADAPDENGSSESLSRVHPPVQKKS